jgi:probable O-glycosylation ligase (exosortase A-associated)
MLTDIPVFAGHNKFGLRQMVMTTNAQKPDHKEKKYGMAFVILVLYFFFEYVRPQSWQMLPVIAPLKIPMFLTLGLFIVFLRGDKSLLRDRLVVYVGLFIFLIGFSVVYAPNTYHVWKIFSGMLVILFCVLLVMPTIISNVERLDRFIFLWVIINALVALFALTHGGHGAGSYLWDENDLALLLNMCIPLSFYLGFSAKRSKKQRLFFKLITLLLVIATGYTMSRGGFLGLLAVFGTIWLMSERKFKSLAIIFLCVMLSGYPVYKLVPETYKTEMSTIFGDNAFDKTRADRIEFWGYGLEMFLDNPILGVGAGNYPWTVHLYQLRKPDYDPDRVTLYGGRPAHSIYFTLIPELGLAGITVFLLILEQIFSRLRRIIRRSNEYKSLNEIGLLAKALLVSTVAYLVTGTFISVLYYPPFWYLIALAITLDRVANAEFLLIDKKEENATKDHSHYRNSGAWRRGEDPCTGSGWPTR